MATILPPYWPMDATHRSGSVITPAYTFIVYIVIVAALRYRMGHGTEMNASSDIAGEGAACAFLIASFVLDYKAAQTGLGLHQATLSSSEIDKAFAYVYAAQLLGILAMWAAKVSIAILHLRMEQNSHGLSLRLKVSLGVAAIWGLPSVFLIAFQCPPPAPWAQFSSGCSTSSPTQFTVIGLNIASDIWFAVAPLPTVSKLNTPRPRRTKIILLLALRLVVPCLSIGQAVAVSRTIQSADKTWERAVQVIWEILVIFFSVLCSVVPRTQKFWAGLQSGGANVEARDQFELTSNPSSSQQLSRGRTRQVNKSTSSRAERASVDSEERLFPASLRVDACRSQASVQASSKSVAWARKSEGHGTGEEQGNGIMHTREVFVARD